MPLFSFFWVFVGLANVGFPGTSGFIPEFMLINSVINFAPILGIFLFFGLLVVTGFFLIFNMRLLYGASKQTAFTWTDLTKVEFFTLSLLSVAILILGLFVLF
jgi:NADH-quinone oxidoreductase subunit M